MSTRMRKAKRTAVIVGDTVYVPLTKGKTAIIDAIDSDLAEFNWQAFEHATVTYARRRLPGRRSDPREWVYLHRIVATRQAMAIDGLDVDHIDGNGLNCRRSNVRPATKSENHCNRRMPSINTSGHKGVCWFRPAKLWVVQVSAKGKKKIHKYFRHKDDAITFSIVARAHLHGEFRREQ